MSEAPAVRPHPRLRKVVQGVLVFLAIYHVATGILCVCFPEYSRDIYAAVYDFNPKYWDQYRLILKPWGSYAIFTGAVLAFAARDPERYRAVIWCMCGLLLVRCGYRLIFAGEAEAVFRMHRSRNYVNVALMLSYNTVLIPWSVLQYRAAKRAPE
ncbi:MAG: hypothetical protein KDD82_03355 [Planctomycetes bacterium]|nr:hypothetical protein [Planctomycetota bacterium]